MKKTFKFRIYPSKSIITKLNRTLELCRFVYNQMLGFRINEYRENKKNYTTFDMKRWLIKHKEEAPELLETIYSLVLYNICDRVNAAYQGFFRRLKKMNKKSGFPRYQGTGRYNSFTYSCGKGFKIENDKLHLSKIGWIKIKQHRSIEGKIKQLTISRSSTNKWYACFSCEVDIKPLRKRKRIESIKLGISTFATLSDGNTIDYPRYYEKAQSSIAKIQQRLSKIKKKSKRYKKNKTAFTKKHERIRNKRHDFLHKQSRKIVDRYGIIILENLNVKKMMAKRWMSKQISDASWSTFIRYVTYKAEWAGRSVIMINPAYTSQTCSKCGEIVEKTLKERIHRCSCGLTMDRDVNAAINIKRLGIQSLAKTTLMVNPKSSRILA